MGFVNIGYALLNNDDVGLNPMLGIGLSGMSLNNSRNVDLRKEDILLEPGNETRLYVAGLKLDFAIGPDFLLFR